MRQFEVGSRECFLESYDRLLRVEVTEEYKKINLDLLKTHYLRERTVRGGWSKRLKMSKFSLTREFLHYKFKLMIDQ